MSNNQQLLEIYLQEYNLLKAEQTKRIGFRDNLLYVTLGIFGTVISFVISKDSSPNYYALLVIPWVCLILGWNYLVNDQKVSAIAEYIREDLIEKIRGQINPQTDDPIWGWEIKVRSDKRRGKRKIQQLIIDEITFVFSGVVALIAFWFGLSKPPLAIYILSWVEFLLLLLLGIEIFIYAELTKKK